MADWQALGEELDRWGDHEHAATFWWRDDDAGPDDSLLPAFLAQRARLGVPLALATVPAWLEDHAAAALRSDTGCRVLQHGVDHTDKTQTDRRKMELCRDALPGGLAQDICRGREILEERIGARFLPVMVPPWNRIDREVELLLADGGFRGLSTLGPCDGNHSGPLSRVNVHIDIIDWKDRRRFAGDAQCLQAAVDHLVARRLGSADVLEPTGLMTHHRVHNADSRCFVDRFVAFVRDHPRARWLDASDIFLIGTPS